jgi:hypothetical protein
VSPERRAEIHARFQYRAPNDAQKFKLQVAHEKIMDLVTFLTDEVPEGRDQAVALTSLEDTRMKINKAIVLGEGSR